MNRRNALLALLVFGSAPLAAKAQRPKVWRIGVLEPGESSTRAHLIEAFKRRLGELGYREGSNLVIELRFAGGKLEDLPRLARELVSTKVDAIVASTTPCIKAARSATSTIPIVMSTVGDPVEEGFVTSFARPGGNITGRTTQSPDLVAKRVHLFKEAVPQLRNMAIFLDSRQKHEVHGLREATSAAKALGIGLRPFEVRASDDIDAAFAAMSRDGIDGLLVVESPINNSFRRRIVELAAKHRLPGIYPFRDFAEGGGFMSFGAMLIDNYRQAAVYVDKILKGAKPGDLPVEQPTAFELLINLKTAKLLGITVPQAILARADQVIQ